MAEFLVARTLFCNLFKIRTSQLDSDARSRYQSKVSYNEGTDQLSDPYSINDWTDDLKEWPDLSFGDIYIYLFETPALFDRKATKAYKSLEAYNYFGSGHVTTVTYNPISEKSPFC